MKKKITFTVICPAFNSEKYIKKTINSVLNQEYLPHEIIFCDDGSKDNTFSIIQSYSKIFKKKKIKFKLKKTLHKGAGNARNVCMKYVTQKYVAFLDSDDYWFKKKLKIAKKNIEKNILCNFFIHWEIFKRMNGKQSKIYSGKDILNNPNIDISKTLYLKNIFSTSAVIVKKELIDNIYFDPKLLNAQDYDFWLKISKKIKVKVIPRFLGKYIERKDNLTSKKYYKKLKFLIIIAFRYRKYVNLYYFIIKIFKIILSKQWIK